MSITRETLMKMKRNNTMRANTRTILIGMLLVAVACALSGCARPYPLEKPIYEYPAGFWSGLWHGMTIVFSFCGSLFDNNIAMYSSHNAGAWYDFGFLIGLAAYSAPVCRSRKGKR